MYLRIIHRPTFDNFLQRWKEVVFPIGYFVAKLLPGTFASWLCTDRLRFNLSAPLQRTVHDLTRFLAMTILFSSLLLAASCFQLLITSSESFKTNAKRSSNAKLAKTLISEGPSFPVRSLRRRTVSSLSQSTENQDDIQTFNTDVVIPKERWDFADDIFLITTTEQGSERLEKTKQQLEKVNMMKKVKIRTFKPDDEDRVRGEKLSTYSFIIDVTCMILLLE